MQILAATTALVVVGWAAGFVASGTGFAVFSAEAAHGVEAASALARLFGALVLFLFLADEHENRLRWVAAGLLVMGLGGLVFGYVEPVVRDTPAGLNETMYMGLTVRILASTLLVIGLVLRGPPRLSGGRALGVLALFFVVVAFAELLGGSNYLPPLALIDDPTKAVADDSIAPQWLTGWHWGLSLVPLGLSVVAAWGASRPSARGRFPGWLIIAAVLYAGSQLHHLLWPSTYGLVLTTADILRFAFALVIAGGAVYELYWVSNERAALLAKEKENSASMRELQSTRADFSAMVAHELASPLLAVRGFAEMLAARGLEPAERRRALDRLQDQADRLDALIADVRASAAVEGEYFEIQPRRVPVGMLLEEADAFAGTLPGDHPVHVEDGIGGAELWADPGRLGQVLRNLVSNAAKYSPEGAPIVLAARAGASRELVRIAVSDRGFGVHSEEMPRIFEKFGRSTLTPEARRASGAGLGLYICRQIVEGHGGELVAESEPGVGSTFAFELELASAEAPAGRREEVRALIREAVYA